ncbi:MAG: flavodoxin family protein [Halanaerobiales bacterium]|nr:flavodoxin family protein [Halanaerobiales bacterium]
MKTLVFFGSARKKGHTKDLLNMVTEKLKGEVEVIDAYRSDISPCIDCKYCWGNRGCSINDYMQKVYPKIDEADNIIFASPLYFNNVPGPLKNIIDRCQVYWAAKRRSEEKDIKEKNALLLICGGAPSYNNQFLAVELVLKGMLKDLNAEIVGNIYVPNTDQVSVKENKKVLKKASKLSSKLERLNN